MKIKRQLESTILLYSELLQQCWRAAPSGHGISFVSKIIKNKKYWYIQNVIGSQKSQFYLGPDSPEIQKKINLEKNLWQTAKPELEKRQKLVAMLNAGGAYNLAHSEARILELMERIGVFLIGGVLVGSHAFRLYSNMLGVRWKSETTQTMDIDVAGDNRFYVGIKDQTIDLKNGLLDAGLGLFEIPTLNKKHSSTSFSIHGQQLMVDILTPLTGPDSEKPLYLKSLKTYASPIRFLDYLLDDVQTAVAVSRSGILVNIPTPARFALHKLVISQRRPANLQTKSLKDVLQAEQLLSILIDERPGDIILSVEAAKSQPKKFWTQLNQGIHFLKDDTLKSRLFEIIKNSGN